MRRQAGSTNRSYRYLSPFIQDIMDRLTKIFLLVWLGLNLLQATFTELLHDEAYYWVFSQYLDWGFKDHPPVTALLVRAGSLLLPGELGVRLFMVLLNTATLSLAWSIVRPKNPILFWLLALAMPVMHIGGFVAVPDVPLIFGALLFLVVWRRFLSADSWTNALLLAGALILLAYTKYHGALFFFFALLPNWRVILRPRFWLICALVGLALVPHFIWQYEHDWLTFRYHFKDRAGDIWKLRFVPEYLAGQIGIWGPLTSLFLWIGAAKWKAVDGFERSLKWITFGFLLFFFYQSWNQPTEANWTAPIFLPLLYLGYHFLENRPNAARWAQRLALFTLILLFVVRVYLVWDFLPGDQRRAPEFHHWDEWAELISSTAGDVPVVFTDRYQRPSKYLFYSRRPGYCVSTNVDTGTQYDLLYEMEEAVQDKRVCLVYEHPKAWTPVDTIIEKTPSGRPLGFRWVDDFRSYNRILCQLDTTVRQFTPNSDIQLPVTIHNPTTKMVSWDTSGPRAVTFEYLFILNDKIIQEGIALSDWPVTSLAPGQSVMTTIIIHTPSFPAVYRLRFAWRVNDLLRGKNSGFYNIEIR